MAPKFGKEDIVWSALGSLFGYVPDKSCPPFDGHSMLNESFWNGNGSQNIPKSAEAYRLFNYLPDSEENVSKILANERKAFMTTELLSYIYEDAHVTFAGIVAMFSKNTKTQKDAQEWLATWASIVDRLALNGRSPGPGMRGAGHDQSPGKRELMRAFMSGDQGRIQAAEVTCKMSKLAARSKWWYAVAKAVLPHFDESAKPTFTKFIKPLVIAMGKDSITAWIEKGDGEWSNVNGNTNPVLVSQIDMDGTRFLPVGGGARVREQFDHSRAERNGNTIIYTSDLQTPGTLTLPNDVVIERLGEN